MKDFKINKVNVKAVLYRSKTLKDGTHPILIRITKGRKVSYIGIGYSLRPENWNEEESKAWESKPRISNEEKLSLEPYQLQVRKDLYSSARVHDLAKVINSKLEEDLASLTLQKKAMEVEGSNITSKNLKKRLQPENEINSDKSFLSYFKSYTQNLYDTGKFGTWNRYDNAYKKLLAYLLKKDLRGKYKIVELELLLKGKDLLFTDLNHDFLTKFEYELKRSELLSTSVESITKTLKSVFLVAYKKDKEEGLGVIASNPYLSYTLAKGIPRSAKKLTKEELETIINLELEENSIIWHVRNFFMFSYYVAGIRVGDLLQRKWKDITPEGRLEYVMDKTNKEVSIKLIKQALDILKFYSNDVTLQAYIFPFLKNYFQKDSIQHKNQLDSKTALINGYLKIIAQKANINKRITAHVSRHSFSEHARKKGVSVHDIKTLLNHSKISTTEVYLKTLDNESSDLELERIFND